MLRLRVAEARALARSLSVGEDLGFEGSVANPCAEVDRELRLAFTRFVLGNDHTAISDRAHGIMALLRNGHFRHLLDPTAYPFAYRFVDVLEPAKLAEIVGGEVSDETYGARAEGVLYPLDSGVSSWTINPRSLVFSGFFSVVPEASHLALFRAPLINTGNAFFGNPDSLASEIGLDAGYAMEREVLALGPVQYDRAVYGLRRPDQSLEGLAMDLVNMLWDVRDIAWSDRYYLPDLK
jgi:hypothetical protein